MAAMATRLTQAVEAYFTGLQLIRASGGATDERSLYVPLANLLNTLGGTLESPPTSSDCKVSGTISDQKGRRF